MNGAQHIAAKTTKIMVITSIAVGTADVRFPNAIHLQFGITNSEFLGIKGTIPQYFNEEFRQKKVK
jgi:hypothetical protein